MCEEINSVNVRNIHKLVGKFELEIQEHSSFQNLPECAWEFNRKTQNSQVQLPQLAGCSHQHHDTPAAKD